MAIHRLETVPYSLPFERPYRTARGELRERDLLLVRLHADEGVGTGETASLSLRGGAGLAAIEREAAGLGPRLEGSGVDLEATRESIDRIRRAGVSHAALAAVEIALWDLCGRAAGKPVWRLLGASGARPVECNATLAAGEPGEVAVEAERWAARGFTTFKLKAGAGEDLEQVRAVREQAGADARIRVDANGVWDEQAAVSELTAMAELGLELAEEPVSGLESLARVRDAVDVPVFADESVNGWREASTAAGRKACDGATVKLAKVGGIGGALEVAQHLPVYLSSALEGPIGIAAAAHVAQVVPDAGLAHGLATELLFADTVAAGPSLLHGSELRVTEAPGLGVEIDDAALATRRK